MLSALLMDAWNCHPLFAYLVSSTNNNFKSVISNSQTSNHQSTFHLWFISFYFNKGWDLTLEWKGKFFLHACSLTLFLRLNKFYSFLSKRKGNIFQSLVCHPPSSVLLFIIQTFQTLPIEINLLSHPMTSNFRFQTPYTFLCIWYGEKKKIIHN